MKKKAEIYYQGNLIREVEYDKYTVCNDLHYLSVGEGVNNRTVAVVPSDHAIIFVWTKIKSLPIEVKFKSGDSIFITPEMEDYMYSQGLSGAVSYTIRGVDSKGDTVVKTFTLNELLGK